MGEAERYFDNEPEPGTPDGDRFSVLVTLIAAYEAIRWPIDPPSALGAIRFRMEQSGYTQADLARLLDSRSHAGEVLAGRRRVSMAMADRLHRLWSIPAEALICQEGSKGSPLAGSRGRAPGLT
jgi:HTH-type transcriptional regulator/antitoxin HigA